MVRYPPDRKEQTRRAVLSEAASGFREHGLLQLSVQDVMKRAGLTHGGFYAHFSSKEELTAEALRHAIRDARERLEERSKNAPGRTKLERLVTAYLTPEHRAHPAKGCTIAALGSEMARLPEASKHLLAPEMEDWIDEYTAAADGDRELAITVVSALVGAMQIARTLPPDKAGEILESVRRIVSAKILNSSSSGGETRTETRHARTGAPRSKL